MLVTRSTLSDPIGTGRDLVVILHGYGSNAEALRFVARVAKSTLGDNNNSIELLVPNLPLGLFSFADPNDIVAELLTAIDARWLTRQQQGDKRPYGKITLVGYSAGSLLVRKLYVAACGSDPSAPLEHNFTHRDTWAWAQHVERIVLLAGMNRGWTISYHMHIWRAVIWRIGSAALTAITFIRRLGRRRGQRAALTPFIFSIRRGAVFITQLRIQWIRMRQAALARQDRRDKVDAETSSKADAMGAVGQATTIQLLGSVDDFVALSDNIDLVSGGDFAYLDVPFTGHKHIITMDASPAGEARKEIFEQALSADTKTLKEETLLPQDDPRSHPDYHVDNVVFVVHGIRDEGYWTSKIARRVVETARKHRHKWATETSTYGFFPMLPFLMARKRREKVEWLMDQYAGMVARYPKATFHYVGHSNGTYCLARALELYPCCRFQRVVFAGSVVRRSFPWEKFLPPIAGATEANAPAQVGSVLNYVASADWVVAGFPNLFQFWPFRLFQDLGSAGFDGFAVARHDDRVKEVHYIRGGHSAALAETNWDAIAEYVYSGKLDADGASTAPVVPERDPIISAIGAFPLAAWLGAGLCAALLGLLVGLVTDYVLGHAARFIAIWTGIPVAPHDNSAIDVAAMTLAAVAGFVAVKKAITRL